MSRGVGSGLIVRSTAALALGCVSNHRNPAVAELRNSECPISGKPEIGWPARFVQTPRLDRENRSK
jgi:hypothetical protein